MPGISAEIDPIALDQIFTFWFPLAPRTIFKEIEELPPAHIMLAEGDNVRITALLALTFPDADDAAAHDRRDPRDLAEELRALLIDATRIRLRADVPVGAYLSGGLDSSIITAIMKRLAPNQLRTFSVTFEDAEYDERIFQPEMVDGARDRAPLGAVHRGGHRPLLSRRGHARRAADACAPRRRPLYLLADLVREQGFKVVLTGEGADEVFAGYDIFKEAKVRRFCAAQPGSKRRTLLLQRLYPYLPQLKAQTPELPRSVLSAPAPTSSTIRCSPICRASA